MVADVINEVSDFFEEMNNQLPDVESTIVNLIGGNGSLEDLNMIFRYFHNIKGTCGMFELEKMQELFHVAESYLAEFRSQKVLPDSRGVELILRVIDEYNTIVKYIKSNKKEPSGRPYRLLADIVDATNEICKNGQPQAQAVLSIQDKKQEKGQKSEGESIRISGKQMNRLAELVSSFFYIQNGLLDILGEDILHKEIKTDVKNFAECLQELLLSIRLAPLKPLLTSLERVVKTTAAQLHKEVNFRIIGDDVGLDRTIIELVREPMIHLLRNSIDHGIELPEQRKKNNKTPQGLITVETIQKTGNVLINIIDDGKGLNKELIIKKALENKLVTSDELKHMEDKEIYKLIFAAGFSTKEEASTISGRGVGMDSVKDMIETVGGYIELDSNHGMGSKVTLSLPSSLAVVKTISFHIGEQLFAVPRDHIDEVYSKDILLENNEIKVLEDGMMILSRHEYSIPIINMHQLFKVDGGENENGAILVLKHGASLVAVEVGTMFKPMNFVAHSLPEEFAGNEFVSGINQLNSGGYVALINVLSIIKLTDSLNQTVSNKRSRTIGDEGKTISDFFRSKQKVITFSYGDKSFAVAVQSVKEVFLIDTKQHKTIKDGVAYIEYDGKSYPTIMLEKYFQTGEPKYGDTIMAILLKHTSMDAVILCETFNGVQGLPPEFESNMQTQGLLGIINFEQSSHLCLNVNELFMLAFPHKFEKVVLDHEKSHYVLIAEDDCFFMKTICSFFDSNKVQYFQAFNGAEAMKILQNKRPDQVIDFILTDYEMPEVDGLEFMGWVKGNSNFKDIPSMMLTAVGDAQTRKSAVDLGINYFINKMNFEQALQKIVEKIKMRIKTGICNMTDFEEDDFSPESEKVVFQERLLTFSLWGNSYGIPISVIKEFSSPSETTKMPLSPHYIDSIIAFRGQPVPLIDLRKIKSGKPLAAEKAELILSLPNGNTCGVWIDSVCGVVNTSSLRPAVGIEKKSFKSGLSSLVGNVYLNKNEPVALLDVGKLSMFIKLVFDKHFEKLSREKAVEILDEVA